MFTHSAILTLFVYLTTVIHMRYLVSNGRATVNHGRSALHSLKHCQRGNKRKGKNLKGRGCRYDSHFNFCGGVDENTDDLRNCMPLPQCRWGLFLEGSYAAYVGWYLLTFRTAHRSRIQGSSSEYGKDRLSPNVGKSYEHTPRNPDGRLRHLSKNAVQNSRLQCRESNCFTKTKKECIPCGLKIIQGNVYSTVRQIDHFNSSLQENRLNAYRYDCYGSVEQNSKIKIRDNYEDIKLCPFSPSSY